MLLGVPIKYWQTRLIYLFVIQACNKMCRNAKCGIKQARKANNIYILNPPKVSSSSKCSVLNTLAALALPFRTATLSNCLRNVTVCKSFVTAWMLICKVSYSLLSEHFSSVLNNRVTPQSSVAVMHYILAAAHLIYPRGMESELRFVCSGD